MSSDSKIKFTTSATSKAAGADVTSETVTMPDHSENHILSVKADPSCSGEVDVELEMSPDGYNWCPAVTRTVSVSAGQSTSARTGNEEYVKLTPDVGEFKNKHCRGGLNFDTNGAVVTPDGSGARDLLHQHIDINKNFNYSQWFKTSEAPSTSANETVTFAVTVVGGLFYIDGVAQPTLTLKEGSTYTFDTTDSSVSGHPLLFSTTSDGSHAGGTQYTTGVTTYGVPGNSGSSIIITVATNAPTLYYYCNNHSGMGGAALTPVNEGYEPVLFRHAGYDDFENSKVPELTESIAQGTLNVNTKVAKGTNSSGNNVNNKDFTLGGTNVSDLPGFLPDIGNYQADFKRMPSLVEAWSFSWWVKLGESGDTLGTSYYVGLWSMGRSASGFLKCYAYNGHIYAGIKQPNTEVLLMCTGARTAGQWYHCSLTKSAGTGSAGLGNQTDQGTLKFYIDGVLQQEQALGTSLSDNNFYSQQITECSILNANPHANNNFYRGSGVAEIAEFSSYKADLHLDEIQALSNGGKAVDPTTVPVSGNKNIPSKICTYFKFGDASNDNSTTHVSFNQIDNAYRTANSRSTISTADPGTMTLETYNSRGTLHALDTSETIYNASSSTAEIKITQNLTSNVSTYSTQFNSISQGGSGNGNVLVDVGSDAATFYGSTGGTTRVALTGGSELDIGKHLLGIYKPDVSFSSSRWLLANNHYLSSGFTHRSADYWGYVKINYTSSNYIRFGGHLNFSPFITYSPSAGAAKKLRVRPVINGSSAGYWYVYANSDGEHELTFTKASGGNLTAVISTGLHCVCTYDPPAYPSQGIPASSVKLYVNGEQVTFRTTTENGVEYVEDAAPSDNLFAGDEVFGHDSAWAGSRWLDYGTQGSAVSNVNNHMDFSNRVLSASDAAKLYNAGKVLDFSNMQSSFPISLTGCVGAWDADVPLYNHNAGYTNVMWGYKDCSSFGKHIVFSQSNQSNFAAVQVQRNNYEPTWMATPSPLSNTAFQAANNLSISGWFKTSGTGILFSNTQGADVSGLKAEVNAAGIKVYFQTSSSTAFLTNNTVAVNDNNWHHILLVLEPGHSTKKQKMYIDGVEVVTSNTALTNETIQGNNGFTLLSDGQNTANNASASSNDSSKLNASISNWSIHSEALDENAAKQLYSNGNVRNIKNLPNVEASNIQSWWQLNDPTNPQNDLMGYNNLKYLDLSGSAGKALFVTPNSSYPTTDGVLITGTNKNPFGTTASDTTLDLADGLGVTMQLKLEAGVTAGQNFSRKVLFSIQCTNGKTIEAVLERGSGSSDLYIVIFMSDTSSFNSSDSSGLLKQFSGGVIDDGNWHTLTFNFTNDNANIVSAVSVFMDGSEVTMSSHPWTGFSNTSFVGTVSDVIIGATNGRSGGNVLNMDMTIDNLAFFTGYVDKADFNSTAAGILYNNRNSLLGATLDASNTPGQPIITSLFTMGDGTTDVIAPNSSIDIKETKYGYRSITPQTNFSSSSNITQLSTSDDPYTSSGGTVGALSSHLIDATAATLVQKTINGNGITMSLTKSFNFTTKKWVSTADQDTALCLSFNGFQEQSEYFAIWKCSQTIAGSVIDICDGGWHNVIISYRGKNDLAGDDVDPGEVVKFGPGPAGALPYNWALSYDGNPLTSINDGSGVDYVGGLNTVSIDSYNSTSYNVGFPIYTRHLTYEAANSEEVYKPHAQFSAGIHEVVGVDNKNAFQGSVDETSFHSDNWWLDQAGTSILTSTYNAEKPATIYGNTTALSNRQGASTDYPEGKPYDLLNPGRLTSGGQLTDIQGNNQYISPTRYDASTNTYGGLEGWWRWGDTPGDCSVTINDVKDHNDSINARDITAFGIVTADRVDMAQAGAAESIYLQNRAATQGSGSASIAFPQVIVENITSGICNLRQMASPILKYLRVKFTGTGSCNLGENSVQAQINFEIKD